MFGSAPLSSFSAQVRLQTQPKAKPGESLMYAGTLDCFKKTLAKEVRPPSPRRFPSIPCLTCLCLVPSRGSKGSTKEWRLQSLESRPCLPFVSLDSVWGGSSSRGAPTTSSRGCFCRPAALCSRTAPQLSASALCSRPPQVSAAVRCRDAVRRVHDSHHGSRRAHQVPPAGGSSRTRLFFELI